MTSKPKRDARYWRDKAEEARLMAASMHVPGGREAMLEIAENYLKMATLAEAEKANDDRSPEKP